MFGVLPWLIGRHLRQRGALLHAGWQRAASLERELAAVSEQERLRERARIAEEMHDSLGHELSLMAVRAGALEVAPGLAEDEFRHAAGDLRQGATTAIERLQEIIGVLDSGAAEAAGERGEDAGAAGGGRAAATEEGSAPESGRSGGVAALVRRAEAAGMRVAWDGREPGGLDPVARLAEAVVREALTNAAKHAPGAPVAVSCTEAVGRRFGPFALGEGATVAEVSSGPAGASDAAGPSGGGRGLSRLAERVRDAGGTLEAGPRGDGGFRVAARIPHGRPAAGTAPSGRADARRSRHRSRELVSVLVVCVGLLLPLIVAWYSYAAYLERAASIGAADYAAITVGQPRSAAQDVLPEASLQGTALVPGALTGAVGGDTTPDCDFYRSGLGPAWSPAYVYRVCYEDGRVAAKCSYQRARSLAPDALSCEGAAAPGTRPIGGSGVEGGA
nr:histidine kinase [Streptomonospora sp. PA3]